MFSDLSYFFQRLLYRPGRVLLWGASLTFMFLIFDGSLWKYWSMQTGQQEMQARVDDLEKMAKQLEFKIHQANNLTYIERQATDQFDYVREGDLIFVFEE